jgi:hypothetical protein
MLHHRTIENGMNGSGSAIFLAPGIVQMQQICGLHNNLVFLPLV